MGERPFEAPVADGVLYGHRGGDGPPALLLHGGPAVSDYMEECARELMGLFHTIRYTQRGVLPSTVGPPYSIESHLADALEVLDRLEIEQAWAIGHSWGGHLALHLAAAHAPRLLGIVCIDPLGADGGVFEDLDANQRRGLTEAEVSRVDEIEDRRRAREATDDELRERWETIWPQFFSDPDQAPPFRLSVDIDCSTDTNASIAEHLARGTLARKLPSVRLPALFVHGEADPLPVRSSTKTAALIEGARVEIIPARGHFPWLEQPGAVRDAVARGLGSVR